MVNVNPELKNRNKQILIRYEEERVKIYTSADAIAALAAEFGLSVSYMWQIISTHGDTLRYKHSYAKFFKEREINRQPTPAPPFGQREGN